MSLRHAIVGGLSPRLMATNVDRDKPCPYENHYRFFQSKITIRLISSYLMTNLTKTFGIREVVILGALIVLAISTELIFSIREAALDQNQVLPR